MSYPVSFIVFIDYDEITALKKKLHEDSSLHAKVYVPQKAKRNPSGISEIRVSIQAQGNDHVSLVEKTIVSCGGTVKNRIDEGKPPIRSQAVEFLKKTLSTMIPAYVAIVATTLSYQPKLNDSTSMWLLFTAISMSAAFAIGSAHLIKLKRPSED